MLRSPADLPLEIEHALRGRDWSVVQIGLSNADVLQFSGGLYLKTVVRNPADVLYGNLTVERKRLEWLQGKVAVPEVVAFASDDARDYLVMTEVRGRNAAMLKPTTSERLRIIESMAVAVRRLHEVDISACPFVATNDALVATAHRRLDAGLVDCNDFDDERLGRDPHELLNELALLKPAEEELVLTHGDLCWPNIVIAGEDVTGFVDVGRAGVADKWRDIALCMRSAWYNWGEDAADEFLNAYGARLEEGRRQFHVLLDEFF